MSESNPQAPKYEFTAEQITQANAGDTAGLARDYVDSQGGFYDSEEDTEIAFIESMKLDDESVAHAARVKEGVQQMYEDAYAENQQHDSAN
jgi:hypothetical protein